MITRRAFLRAVPIILAAPAIIKIDSLMRLSPIQAHVPFVAVSNPSVDGVYLNYFMQMRRAEQIMSGFVQSFRPSEDGYGWMNEQGHYVAV